MVFTSANFSIYQGFSFFSDTPGTHVYTFSAPLANPVTFTLTVRALSHPSCLL